ncbi:MAG: hypothetical protein K6G10_04120 [Butyrivibrio sp.]|nr:hypothetical protein [Butyrivibrio sp.]
MKHFYSGKHFISIILVTILFILSALPVNAAGYGAAKTVTVTMDREEILEAENHKGSSNKIVKWDDFWAGKKDTYDGSIPASLLDDPVYCSMNLPSESRSQTMIDSWRDNAHITGYIEPPATKVLSIGAIYSTAGVRIENDINICIGKIKLFAFSKSQGRWITVDSQKYPTGLYFYKMPWGSEGSVPVAPKKIEYKSNYVRVTLTPEEINSSCLHFWGKSQDISEDYLYYACAYEFWVEDKNYKGGDLTATLGIDAKTSDSQATVSQLFSSRGITPTSSKKVIWGHTIPSTDYNRRRDGDTLLRLFKR